MDVVLLSRIQFGLNAGFHFLFPPITLGLTLIILIIESIYLKTDNELYKKLSTYLIKILGLVFVVGVATGIVLEFSFGTNWANYSRMVGDIFGAPLAAEGIFSFFLESVFLAVLLFGRERVSKRTFWLSAFLVFFASHLSALWIIIANSWMQTPAGFALEGGRAVLKDFFQAAMNHSTIERYLHTLIGSWITGSLFVAGISAWYFIKKRDQKYAKPMLNVSIIIFMISAILQFGAGHAHSVQVAKTQPEKMAAFEALWESKEGAPLAVFGIPDEKEKKTHFEIGIPKLLSFLIYFDPDAKVTGLNEFPENEQPPVLVPYIMYHIMIGLGSLFALMAVIAAFLMMRKKLYDSKWFHYILLLTIPLPLVSNEVGWIAAEIGRQPWAVYRVLRTADAASFTVPAWQILLSIIVFSLIYILLLAVFMKLLIKLVKKGPGQATSGY